MAEKRERDPSEEIRKHLMQCGVNKENPAYLVRGAELVCSQGTNKRMMNLNKCHGVYIKEHAVVHELDCIQGDEENITWFGVCNPGEGLETDDIELIGDNGEKCHGKKCKPYLIGTWYESFEGTRIVDNGDKKQEDGEEPEGCNTITTDSFLVCKYGGIIMPVNSGQDREVSADEFDYETGEEREAALARVQEPCEEEIDREEGCEDLLHAKLSEDDEWSRHGSIITPVESGHEIAEKNEAVTGVSEKLISLLKSYETGMDRNGDYLKDGEPALYPYHSPSDASNVLTIGWGHAMKNKEEGWFTFSDGTTINLYSMCKEDGNSISGITEEQANEIFDKDIAVREEKLNDVIEDKGIEYKINQQFYDALFSLSYQMGMGYLTNGGSLSEFLEEDNFDLSDIKEIKNQFGDFTNGLEKGTMRRRADEIDIILQNDYARDMDETRYGDIWRKKTYPDIVTPGY